MYPTTLEGLMIINIGFANLQNYGIDYLVDTIKVHFQLVYSATSILDLIDIILSSQTLIVNSNTKTPLPIVSMKTLIQLTTPRVFTTTHKLDGTTLIGSDTQGTPFFPFGTTGSSFNTLHSTNLVPVSNTEPLPSTVIINASRTTPKRSHVLHK